MIAGATTNGQPKARLTQKRAAELLGVTRWHLNRVIRGHVKSIRLLGSLAELQSEHQKHHLTS
jgi:predicted XRE-type DNA-binding protein